VRGIGELLLQTARCIPQGILVFFPSYTQLNFCIERWKVYDDA
jgi:Rad3-related DNA helicase